MGVENEITVEEALKMLAAAKLQIEAIPLVGALFCEVNPIPVKKAIELQGRDTGVVRRPLTEMEPQNAERLKKEMQAYNVL